MRSRTFEGDKSINEFIKELSKKEAHERKTEDLILLAIAVLCSFAVLFAVVVMI